MRPVSKRNFSSAKYEKFIWPPAKRSWSFTRATKKKERCCTPSVPAENPPSSSGWHSNVVLLLNLMMSFLCTVFSWAFPSYTLKFDFSFLFLNFVWVLKNFLNPYNHVSLLSSQSIRRRRSSSDLNSQPTTSQPYLLATRVPECPQSFTSFLVRHFLLCLLSCLVV
jgi:hypothetical protein